MNERSRGRNVSLMLVALDFDGKPALAEIIFAGQISNTPAVTPEILSMQQCAG
ncbi:hypothetical protein ABN228_20710 [Providencia rettgeri]|uniref:hypothetical protein n=1 Tax=Providencia rettgeri TaxID=587 RepID=UPI0032DA21FF